MIQPPRLRIIMSLVFGLIAMALSPIFVRLAGNVSPLALTVWRTCFAVLFLLPFRAGRQMKHRTDPPVSRRGLFLGMLAGLCLGLHLTLWTTSLSYTTVASASVLVQIHPIILIVLESLLFHERFSGSSWIGVFIAFGGSVLLAVVDTHAAAGFSHPLWGDLLALSAAVLFAGYFLIGRKVRQQYEWLGYIFRVYTWAAVTCLVLAFILGISLRMNGTAIVMALALAAGPQIVGHGSMNFSLKYISPTLLSTLILGVPLIAIALAFILFRELPSILSFGAIAMVIAGIAMTWYRKREIVISG